MTYSHQIAMSKSSGIVQGVSDIAKGIAINTRRIANISIGTCVVIGCTI